MAFLSTLALHPPRSAHASDRMVVTDVSTGAVLFDAAITEPAGDVDESSLLFGSSDFPSTGAFGVLLSAPPGEPPGEAPVFFPGTDIVISDLVVSNFGDLSGQPGVMLVSDGSPLLAQALPRSTGFPIVEETGELQDLTSLLGGDAVGLRVQVSPTWSPSPGRSRSWGLGSWVSRPARP